MNGESQEEIDEQLRLHRAGVKTSEYGTGSTERKVKPTSTVKKMHAHLTKWLHPVNKYHLDEKVNYLSIKLDEQVAVNVNLKSQLGNLRRQLGERDIEIGNLQRQLNVLNKENDELIIQLNDQFVEKMSDQKELHDYDKLRDQLELLCSKYKSLESTVNQLKAKNKALLNKVAKPREPTEQATLY
uniref:Uncharacterized protein n=1 Tax=Acrobeloides nanus TaxID=290746 RepID=A0A914EQI3_9BILA